MSEVESQTALGNVKLDKIIRLLEELLKWARIEGVQKVKSILHDLLRTDVEKLVYEHSDGRASREVAEVAGVSHATVVNYWNKWVKYGIVEELRARGGTRYGRVFSLSEFGIEIPEVKSTPIRTTDVKRQNRSDENASQLQS